MSSATSGMFRTAHFRDSRRSLRVQVGVIRVLRDALGASRDPDRTTQLLQHLDDELDRLDDMIEHTVVE